MPPKAKKPPLTHFLCIPLVTASAAPQWQASLDRFRLDAIVPTAAAAAAPKPPAVYSVAADAPTRNITSQDSSTPNQSVADPHGSPPGSLATKVPLAWDGSPGSISANRAQTAVQSLAVGATTATLAQTQAKSRPGSAKETRDTGSARSLLQTNAKIPTVGLPPKAIRPLHSLHLTLGVMSLGSSERLEEAKRVLGGLDVGALLHAEVSVDHTASGPAKHTSPLRLTMTSLLPMQSDRSTSVLYAQPDEPTGRLLPFCQALRQAFVDHELIVDEGRDLKLHASVMNTLQAKASVKNAKTKAKQLPPRWGRPGRSSASQAGKESPLTAETVGEDNATGNRADGTDDEEPPMTIGGKGKIDAHWLIERWKDHIWAEVEVEKIAICEMGAKADENGIVRYKEVAEIAVPR